MKKCLLLSTLSESPAPIEELHWLGKTEIFLAIDEHQVTPHQGVECPPDLGRRATPLEFNFSISWREGMLSQHSKIFPSRAGRE